ncbi:CRISPR-associated endonuclease Cas3'' [Endozoicomonas acroporae]|uniref:CRISPR-associated endonuclease Cas3'' n=1 Tax=Endozoicomonas acroporae TaxID=1701104 RepID=UPI003D7A4CA6
MDIPTNKPVNGVFYANTKLQRLDQHLFGVAYAAQTICQKLFPDNTALARAVFVAGAFHDTGKLDPCFQSWVVKLKNQKYIAEDGQHIDESRFSFEKHPRHNEISALLYMLADDRSLKSINTQNKKSVKHGIYWHHAKPFRKEGDFETYGSIYKKLDRNLKGQAWADVVGKLTPLLRAVSKIDQHYRNTDKSLLSKCYLPELDPENLHDIEGTLVPAYKEYDSCDQLSEYSEKLRFNAINDIVRSCVITADRWVSSLTAQELDELINKKGIDELVDDHLVKDDGLSMHIDECLSRFSDSDRTQKQMKISSQLAQGSQVQVLAGAAGCGKTKIALEWANLKNARKILWVCPRVQICQGLFLELTSTQYLPDASIEIYTGEFKFLNSYDHPTPEGEYLSGDIVITTIDQLFAGIISHTRADLFIEYLNTHTVFDEFHEYINMPAFNLLFAELVDSRFQQKNANTLLVSATPHYFYLDQILGIRQEDVVVMPSFNSSQYQFCFLNYDETQEDSSNPLYKPYVLNTFVISNTATTAQKSYIANQHQENAILLHSKFKKFDKRQLFDEVYEAFCNEGTLMYQVLRSGPIVQASLNISCDNMVSEITTAENTLQRLGRLDRFGVNANSANKLTLVIPDSFAVGKGTGAVARFLARNNNFASTKAWYEFLLDNSDSGSKVFVLAEIYELYLQFYQSDSARNALMSDLLASMKKSVKTISSKVSEPLVFIRKKQKGRPKIARTSLRGDSRFVQMALCSVTHPGQPVILNQYAYDVSVNENVAIDNLTESLDKIRNDGLLDYLAQKHGRVDETSIIKGIPANKMSARKNLLEGYAKDPEYPLYLSYTPDDLSLKLGGEAPHSEANYYAICDKQPIGAIAFKQLLTKEGS